MTDRATCPHSGATLIPLKRPGFRFAVSPVTKAIHFLDAAPVSYDSDYFLEEYQKQYGKSYFEDEPNLRLHARKRISRIERYMMPPASLLEIGSACGYFLDEARSRGFRTTGIEISQFASDYARNKFKLNIHCSPFSAEMVPKLLSENGGPFDVVAAFFVIEHFSDQKSVFQSIASLLKPGGVFAFAVPSSFGPVYCFDPERFNATHPVDHFVDYSPQSLRKIFPLYGLRAYRFIPASFHPERISPFCIHEPFRSTYALAARLLAFGDTLEGFAVRM